MPDKVKLNKHYVWDILEVKVRHMMGSQPLFFTFNVKTGI